ncbi:MAG: tetratricopeptide repeat protein [Chloroflexota bacterium]
MTGENGSIGSSASTTTLRAAVNWLTLNRRTDEALHVAYTLSQFSEARGYSGEGRHVLDRLLSVPDADAGARAAGLYAFLHLEWSGSGNLAFQGHGEELLALCKNMGDSVGAASALHDLGVVASQQRRYADARQLLEEHLALSRHHGVPPSPRARQNLGNVARDAGDFSGAHVMYTDAQAQDGNAASMRGLILSNMGWLALYEGDLSRARAWQAESSLSAGSIALIAFGLDSVVEVASALVIAWRLSRPKTDHAANERAERRAVRLIALTFFAIAAYVVYDGATSLLGWRDEPRHSPLGLPIIALSLLIMPCWRGPSAARQLD